MWRRSKAWQQIKRILSFVSGLFLGVICLTGAAAFLYKHTPDLNSALKSEGQIVSSHAGKYFVFKLADNPVSYGVYRPSRSYDDLTNALSIGDSVTVYFPYTSTTNVQIYQVEKQGQVIVSKDLLGGQNLAGGIICLIAGPTIIAAAIWEFRRKKNRDLL